MSEEERKKVSVNVQLYEDIKKGVHILCIEKGVPMRDWMENAIVAAYKNEIECKGGDNGISS